MSDHLPCSFAFLIPSRKCFLRVLLQLLTCYQGSSFMPVLQLHQNQVTNGHQLLFIHHCCWIFCCYIGSSVLSSGGYGFGWGDAPGGRQGGWWLKTRSWSLFRPELHPFSGSPEASHLLSPPLEVDFSSPHSRCCPPAACHRRTDAGTLLPPSCPTPHCLPPRS